MVAEECEKKDADRLREMGGEGIEAEEAIADGDEPVRERGFFEVADAVDLERDPIAGEGHVAGGTGVRGVGVVEQRRGEEGGEEDGEPKQREDGEGGGAARVRGQERAAERCGSEGGGGEMSHEVGLWIRIPCGEG